MTPQLHVTALVLGGTTAAAALVAVWAATSGRHWFWRALAIWICVALMLPIGAYEPALVFAMSLPGIALAVRGFQWRAEQRGAIRRSFSSRVKSVRFGLRDILLATALLGLSLAAAVHVARRPALESDWLRAKTAAEIVLPALAMTLIAVCCWCAICGRHRWWSSAALLAAICGFAWRLWPRMPWLYALDEKFNLLVSMVPSSEIDRLAFLVTLTGLGEFAAILVALIWATGPEPTEGTLWRSVRLGTLALGGALLAAFYWQMFGQTSFPPPLVSSPNHFRRIMEIAHRMKQINESSLSASDVQATDPAAAEELRGLYDELLPLLPAPNSVDDDLSSPLAQQIREGRFTDQIGAIRALGRSLDAESRAAAARGDLNQALQFALAEIRLGAATCRNGLMIDDLIGRAVMSGGYRQVAGLRKDIDAQNARHFIAALASIDQSREPTSAIIQRDMAYCERVYGWQARLSNIIERLITGDPRQWQNFASYIHAIQSWQAINRLLQVDLAIELFRRERGRLPASLSELAPDFGQNEPFDPFTERPLVYRTDDNAKTFTLYSVGRDGRNDGGRLTSLSTYHSAAGYDLDVDTLTRP